MRRARENVNGSVNLRGLSSKAEASSVNGSVSLQQVSGRIDASTVNGSLRGEQLSGSAELSTVNGGLELNEARLTVLDARTVSGDIRAAMAIDPAGTYSFSSTNSSCLLVIPPDSRCSLTMQAVNGGVEVELPHQTVASEMRPAFSRWVGTLNGGGAALSFCTINGGLRVASSQPTGAGMGAALDEREARAEPEPSAPSTMDILRAVERGEMTADEAMQKIREKPR